MRATLESLKANLANLNAYEQGVAKDLIAKAESRPVSEKQAAYIESLARRASEGAKPKVAVTIEGIAKLFQTARTQGKSRVAILLETTATNETVRLSLAANGSGDIYIKSKTWKDEDGQGLYYGKLTKEGEFIPYRKRPTPSDLIPALTEFAGEPVTVAQRYARKTGACCFCGIQLTDERSLAVSYGPICANTFGLPWG